MTDDQIRPQRKRIRLPAAAYSEPGRTWHVTLAIEGREAVFAYLPLAEDVARLIRDRCVAMATELHLYCLMPDHAHLVVQVNRIDLVNVVRDIKSRSTRLWWSHGGHGSLWQRSFIDRGLWTTQDYDRAVDYVLNNPVKAGIVADWQEYPLLGGSLLRNDDDRDQSA
ncbi:MAG TPA: transposase [Thermomicrobiales bacterium]|jgi:REP element-mobilizing transposase RayT